MKIFISYRRDDSAGYAGRLFDYLSARFGARNVFMDIDTIEPGEDFRTAVRNAVETCDVVLVMIGKHWAGMLDAQGQRRLDDPRDLVRMEVAAALVDPRGRVIPVLLRDARMPGEHELPDDLKDLAWRNAIELSDNRFQYDVRKLIGVIERGTGKPDEVPPVEQQRRGGTKFLGIFAALVLLAMLIGMVGYALNGIRPQGSSTPAVEVTSTSAPTETPTSLMSLIVTSTRSVSSAPVIDLIDLPSSIVCDGRRYDVPIHFRDLDGDAHRIYWQLIYSKMETTLYTDAKEFFKDSQSQMAGTVYEDFIQWFIPGDEVIIRVYIEDRTRQAGYMDFEFKCSN